MKKTAIQDNSLGLALGPTNLEGLALVDNGNLLNPLRNQTMI